MTLKHLALALSVVSLCACASTPDQVIEPVVAQQAPTVEPTPEPVFVQPAPVERVTQAPIVAPVTNPNLPIAGSAADFAYQAGDDRVYFDYNRHDLNAQARATLGKQAEWLNQYERVRVVIEGNADERGTREYNLALGARRANSVKDYLVNLGVKPNRLITVSYGKERPIDGRSSDDGWARNRNSYTNLVSGTIG